MKLNVLPGAAIGLFVAAGWPLPAQVQDETPSTAPKVLMIIQEQIKEGREVAHAQAEEAWPRIFRKGNVKSHYVGMNSITGPPTAWFLEPYESFGGMAKDRAEITRSFTADLEAANVKDGDLRTGSRTLLSVFRGDLSYHSAEAMSAMPKSRFMGVTVLRIKYGRDADLAQLARLIIDGDEKSNNAQPVLTYQVVSGGQAGTFMLLSPMDSLARMDEAPARSAAARQAMGDRSRQHFDSLAPETIQSSESLLFAFDPKMSYVSPEFAAADPDFWNPKPEAPAKPKRKP
jgi:hypothetical protein